jgi:CRP/FNR family transcriptional regulator, cyclic AMP receptor protein
VQRRPVPPVPSVTAVWRAVPYLRDQGEDVYRALGAASVEERYRAGALIFLQDDPVAGLYVIASGTVKISRLSREGREHILHLAQPGETFNEVTVLDGGPNPATATAHTDVVAWRVRRDALRGVAEAYPAVAWALAGHIADRARYLLGIVEDLAMRTVKGRLARLLLEQAAASASGEVARSLTQEEMASRLGTVREMIGRVLRSLSAAGIIAFDRHRIIVLDPDRLADEADT